MSLNSSNGFQTPLQHPIRTISFGQKGSLSQFALASLLMLAVSCSSAPKKEVDGLPGTDTPPAADTAANSDMKGKDMDKSGLHLQTVHFPYDSAVLNEEEKSVMQDNASQLKAHPEVAVQIEGHCDQRGGVQYNLALGEKRAETMKRLLVDLGVKAKKMTVISFGKEKPVDSEMNEEGYSKNRRAEFVVMTGDGQS